MKQYYLDTSVLLVYTLASGTEVGRYADVLRLFNRSRLTRLNSVIMYPLFSEMANLIIY